MRGRFLFFLLYLFGHLAYGQTVKYPFKTYDFSPKVKSYLDKLLLEKFHFINEEGEFLADSCSTQEIIKLLSCSNPTLRAVACKILVLKNESDLFTNLLNHLDDKAIVNWSKFSDSWGNYMVSDLFLRLAKDKLSQAQRDTIVNRVLLRHNYLNQSCGMIEEIKPNEKYYSIIKSKIKKENNRQNLQVLYGLAKFKKQQDVSLLKNGFIGASDRNFVVKIIRVFPDTAFQPVLSKYLNKYFINEKDFYDLYIDEFCETTVQYKNKWSLSIFERIVNASNYQNLGGFEENKKSVFSSLSKYNSSIYATLYYELKTTLDPSFIKKFYEKKEVDPSDFATW